MACSSFSSSSSSSLKRSACAVDPCAPRHQNPDLVQLLLPRVYRLNHSFGKKIIMGLRLCGYKHVEPVVKLLANDYVGVAFSTGAWGRLRKDFGTISKYLSTDTSATGELDKGDRIDHEKHFVVFTESYGQRAVVISEKKKKETPYASGCVKRSKTSYQQHVIMQRTTFENLTALIPCITHYMNHLCYVQEGIERCIKFMLKTIPTQLEWKEPSDITGARIREFFGVSKNYDDLKEEVDTVVGENFLQSWQSDVDLVYSELTTLHTEYLAADIVNFLESDTQ